MNLAATPAQDRRIRTNLTGIHAHTVCMSPAELALSFSISTFVLFTHPASSAQFESNVMVYDAVLAHVSLLGRTDYIIFTWQKSCLFHVGRPPVHRSTKTAGHVRSTFAVAVQTSSSARVT